MPGTEPAAEDISQAAAEATESIAEPIEAIADQSLKEAAVVKQEVVKAVKEKAERIGRGVKGAYRAAQKSGRELEEKAQKSIRQIPITTVLAAMGIGLVLGYVGGRAHGRNSRGSWRQ